MIGARLRAMRGSHWLVLYGALALGWFALVSMSYRQGGSFGAALWDALCAPGAEAGIFGLWAMWSLMGAAMMLPTALPALSTFDDLSKGDGGGFLQFAGGFVAVWAGFAVVAALAQYSLGALGLIGAAGESLSIWLSAILLIGAGVYQFSALKAACLSRCRTPIGFFMSHWDQGPLRMGLRMGAICLGCCWALMALGFVGGVMNLAFMTGAMVLMFLEKLPQIGAPLTRPIGVGLIAAGLALPVLA